MSDRVTQAATVLRLLREQGAVSVHDLIYHYGITRAAACIWDLRRAGHAIDTDAARRLPDGTRTLATYRLRVGPSQLRIGL